MQTLGSLLELDLSSNMLQGQIPSSLSSLQKLKTLNLSQNRLSSLPDNISALRQLTEMKLSFNSLREIPEDVIQLALLQTLDFRDNQIGSLPKDLSRYQSIGLNCAKRYKPIPSVNKCLIADSIACDAFLYQNWLVLAAGVMLSYVA